MNAAHVANPTVTPASNATSTATASVASATKAVRAGMMRIRMLLTLAIGAIPSETRRRDGLQHLGQQRVDITALEQRVRAPAPPDGEATARQSS